MRRSAQADPGPLRDGSGSPIPAQGRDNVCAAAPRAAARPGWRDPRSSSSKKRRARRSPAGPSQV